MCHTSFDVKRKNVGGNGLNNGGSHLFEFDRTVDDDVATAAAPVIDGHLTFGDAAVIIDDDTIVELIGTIKSSSATLD